jgi:PKD repeat protein
MAEAAAEATTIAIAAALAVVCAWGLGAGCDGTPTYYLDGGVEPDGPPPRPEAGPRPDGSAGVFAEVSLSGCAESTVTETELRCLGQVPLTVSFAALAPPDAESFVWVFGDGSDPNNEPAPTHRYQRPGTFTVNLVVGGPFGPLSPTRPIRVTVTAAPLGAWCDRDEQCATAHCLCADAGGEGCPAILSGTCSAPCPGCGAEGICADLQVLDATGTADVAAWRQAQCLPGCEHHADCPRPGFRCRAVPTRDATGSRDWQGACLPAVLADVGAGCAGPAGEPDPAACLSGDCAALGRFGLCTDPCALSPCPDYAACALFSGGPRAGEPVCLARCSPSRPCDHDPALACTTADPLGELGFSILDPGVPATATFCAPRRCTDALDCPSGICDQAAGGFCI